MELGFKLTRKRVLLSVAAAALALSSAGVATTLVTNAYTDRAGIYHGCVGDGSGILRVLGAGQTCRANEVAIEWNQGGPTGAQGPVGEKGPMGDKGPLGDKGPTGDAGAKGATGDAGAAGAIGDKGPTGDKGLTGDKGETGDQGAIGDKGPTGDKGLTGDAGDKGLVGDKGPTGDQGPAGPAGPAGSEIGDTIVRTARLVASTQILAPVALCPQGTVVVGGGHILNESDFLYYDVSAVRVMESTADPTVNGWRVRAFIAPFAGQVWSIGVQAVCLPK